LDGNIAYHTPCIATVTKDMMKKIADAILRDFTVFIGLIF
jgi:hypothetical protein